MATAVLATGADLVRERVEQLCGHYRVGGALRQRLSTVVVSAYAPASVVAESNGFAAGRLMLLGVLEPSLFSIRLDAHVRAALLAMSVETLRAGAEG